MTTKRQDPETGELIEIQDNGETVVNIQNLEETIDSINGNPAVKEALQMIVEYLKKEG